MTEQKPTRTRYWVVAFAASLAVVTYIDRVCISQAAPLMQKDLGLDKVQMGYAFVAFAWAYALFEVPGGWLGDWMGPRRVLMRIVIWWSLFTAATGWVTGLISLILTRFLFGAGEAGCFPNLTKAFTTWLRRDERVRAQGIMWMSARWGGAFTPLLVVWVLRHMSWRYSFMLFGGVGVVWAVFFYLWYRDNPRDHKRVNARELELLEGADEMASGHGDVPWLKLISSRTVWLLWAQYFLLSWGWYFYITWLPTYLQEARGLNKDTALTTLQAYPALRPLLRWFSVETVAALLAIPPLFGGGVGSILCGQILPWVGRLTGSVTRARRVMACIGFVGASVLLVIAIRTRDPVWTMIAMGLSSMFNDFVMPPAWGACMDVGGKYAGTLSGSMNMMGNFAGGLAPVVTAHLLKLTHNNWDVPLLVSAGLYFLGTFCWMHLDPVTPLEAARKK